MTTRSAAARQALGRFGDLSWFKLPVEYNHLKGYHQVPYMGWRFMSPQEETARTIRNAIKAVDTQVEWELDTSRSNWLLLPSRIALESQGAGGSSFADTVHAINVNDQEFCLKALSDFEKIVKHLQRIPVPD